MGKPAGIRTIRSFPNLWLVRQAEIGVQSPDRDSPGGDDGSGNGTGTASNDSNGDDDKKKVENGAIAKLKPGAAYRKRKPGGLGKGITHKGSLPLLCNIFGLGGIPTKCALNDVVFVAIDFEGTTAIRSGFSPRTNSQAGLAILDTKMIGHVPPDRLISTYNFVTGSEQYIAKATKKFQFGNTLAIQPPDIVRNIASVMPPGRNIVLVGHGIPDDLHALDALSFSAPMYLRRILDTFKVAREVFGSWPGSLRDLLVKLGVEFNRLHSAGNDANFTLRALLMLVVKGFADTERCGEVDGWKLDLLKKIANAPIPDWVDPEVEARRRREELELSRSDR